MVIAGHNLTSSMKLLDWKIGVPFTDHGVPFTDHPLNFVPFIDQTTLLKIVKISNYLDAKYFSVDT